MSTCHFALVFPKLPLILILEKNDIFPMSVLPSIIRPSWRRRLIQTMTSRIQRAFRPDKVILFGSCATGHVFPDSDIDLLVIMPDTVDKRRKQVEIRMALHDIKVAKDVIVMGQKEYLRGRSIPGTLARVAEREGKVLYAKTR